MGNFLGPRELSQSHIVESQVHPVDSIAMPGSVLIENCHPWGTRRGAWQLARAKIVDLFWVIIMCLVAEVVIWGIGLALSGPQLECLASIFGMVCVFVTMELLGTIRKET